MPSPAVLLSFRVWLCSSGENQCPGAETNGVSIVHGNALAFVNGHEMKIQKVRKGEQARGEMVHCRAGRLSQFFNNSK